MHFKIWGYCLINLNIISLAFKLHCFHKIIFLFFHKTLWNLPSPKLLVVKYLFDLLTNGRIYNVFFFSNVIWFQKVQGNNYIKNCKKNCLQNFVLYNYYFMYAIVSIFYKLHWKKICFLGHVYLHKFLSLKRIKLW